MQRHFFRWTLMVVLASPIAVSAQDKPASKADAKNARVPAGELTGRIIRVESAQKTLAMQIRIPYLNGRDVAYLTKDIDLQTADDVKVRMLNPPLEFDAKGNPRKYTKKELKELRGPENLPGYPGDFDSLKVDQMVQVFFKKQKEAPKPAGGKKGEPGPENRPQVTMIVILVEPKKQ